MPRFFFSFAGEPEMIGDEELELADAATARREAICCLGEMLRDQSNQSRQNREWQLAVHDDRGVPVVRVRVSID